MTRMNETDFPDLQRRDRVSQCVVMRLTIYLRLMYKSGTGTSSSYLWRGKPFFSSKILRLLELNVHVVITIRRANRYRVRTRQSLRILPIGIRLPFTHSAWHDKYNRSVVWFGTKRFERRYGGRAVSVRNLFRALRPKTKWKIDRHWTDRQMKTVFDRNLLLDMKVGFSLMVPQRQNCSRLQNGTQERHRGQKIRVLSNHITEGRVDCVFR